MGVLIDGKWTDGELPQETSATGQFKRVDSAFRDRVTADGSSGFKAEPGRYHLYVAHGCPWAHRTLIYRALKKLDGLISVAYSIPGLKQQGWQFGDDPRYPTSWSHDDRELLFEQEGATGLDVAVLGANGEKRPLLAGPYNERNAEHSPDGRFLAFVSDESGRSEVYVARYPSLEGRSAVSLEGGTNPRWSRDGRELFFRQGDAVMAASVDSRGGARVERPRRLFAGSYDGEGRHGSFDVAADGRRFVMVEDDEASALRELTLVQGFFEELRRLAPPAPGAAQ